MRYILTIIGLPAKMTLPEPLLVSYTLFLVMCQVLIILDLHLIPVVTGIYPFCFEVLMGFSQFSGFLATFLFGILPARDGFPPDTGCRRFLEPDPAHNTSTLITSRLIRLKFDSLLCNAFYFAASRICTGIYHFMIVAVLLLNYRNIKEQFSDVLRSKYHFERKWRRMESNHS